MKRSPELVTLTRRDMCGGLAACLGAFVISGCGGDSGGDATVDATPTDSSGSGACGTGAVDVGAPSLFQTGKPVYISSKNVFILRDANGLYALTARCTHQGRTITARTTEFYCPGHGATFDFNGAVTKGPATSPLKHYALCLLPSGNIAVDTTIVVAASSRLVA